MKQFINALNKEGKCFQYIISQFLQLSNAKLKEGVLYIWCYRYFYFNKDITVIKDAGLR